MKESTKKKLLKQLDESTKLRSRLYKLQILVLEEMGHSESLKIKDINLMLGMVEQALHDYIESFDEVKCDHD